MMSTEPNPEIFMFQVHDLNKRCSKWPISVFQFSIVFCPAAMWAVIFGVQ